MPKNKVAGMQYKKARVGGGNPARKRSTAAAKKVERFQPGTRRAIKRGGMAKRKGSKKGY